VYCTHEYTLSNLAFAAAVEPDNGAIAERIVASQALRAANRPTVPFPLAGEMLTNPFLRTGEAAVIRQAETRAGAASSGPWTCLRRCGNGKTVSDQTADRRRGRDAVAPTCLAR
jgi:hydroxyacylglutathione hydrolase